MKARALAQLQVGIHVVIQGGNKKWSKQGKIIEFLGNRQYCVKLLGSGRITLCSRRFLRECHHIKQEITPCLHGPDTTSKEGQVTNSQDNSIPPQMEGTNQFMECEESLAPQELPSSLTADIPAVAPRKKTPRALKNLKTFNKPGRAARTQRMIISKGVSM